MRRSGSSSAPKPASAKARWKAEALLEELKQVAERLGLRVREEKLLREVGYQVRSGACRVNDENLVFLDRELPVPGRLEILADVVSRRDLEGVYLSPELRRMLGVEEPA